MEWRVGDANERKKKKIVKNGSRRRKNSIF
jgi:hypothetical protein